MEKLRKAFAGKRGEKIRSDCFIEIELTRSGGIKSSLQSKVAPLYGDSIDDLILSMCDFFEIKNANILIEDSGALPFAIAARFEAAYKQIVPDDQREFLPQINKASKSVSSKDRMRRSRLYLPGNSVAPAEKESARYLVRNALRSVNFYNAERMVRINQLPIGLVDLAFVVPHNVHVILIPKCESAETVRSVEQEINSIKAEKNIHNKIYLMPIIESALGVMNAYEIATSSENVCALTIGLEDYTADIGVERTNEGRESLFARCQVINAAKAAGVQAIDTVFSDVNDMDGLHASVLEAKSLGFEGKGCIHPRQIQVVHKAFAPTIKEIEKADKIITAFEDAKKKGIGVITLGSKMIDAPVVKRAQRIIDLARLNNLIDKN
jgi:citrate lyase subunit beta/citryl-CoA lyase